MNNRPQTIQHHEVKAEIGINIIDEILNVFNESTIMLPKKFVVILENTLTEARNAAVVKYHETKKKEDEEKTKA
jgi:hypothetical protein